ncbi:hypothetical protein I7I48_07968 [Histoplasma ohiense]|nr:hypothetical protein I7I48_07968 [Histoplasma ohiense (nom. inval.)]
MLILFLPHPAQANLVNGFLLLVVQGWIFSRPCPFSRTNHSNAFPARFCHFVVRARNNQLEETDIEMFHSANKTSRVLCPVSDALVGISLPVLLQNYDY